MCELTTSHHTHLLCPVATLAPCDNALPHLNPNPKPKTLLQWPFGKRCSILLLAAPTIGTPRPARRHGMCAFSFADLNVSVMTACGWLPSLFSYHRSSSYCCHCYHYYYVVFHRCHITYITIILSFITILLSLPYYLALLSWTISP